MTYEKFCTRVLEINRGNEKVTRKTIGKVAIRLLVMFAMLSLAIGYLIGCVFPSFSIIGGLVLFGCLIFFVFDYISETVETYQTWSKISKFWWLFFILMVVAMLAMRLYLR